MSKVSKCPEFGSPSTEAKLRRGSLARSPFGASTMRTDSTLSAISKEPDASSCVSWLGATAVTMACSSGV
jgi:hypothetical protein